MEHVEFQITIKASPEKIWKVLWNNDTYTEWTSPFMPNSRVEAEWKVGAIVKFLGPDENGMLSKIVKYNPYKEIFFTHQGVVNKGMEDTNSAGAKEWQGAVENYTFIENNGVTELKIKADIIEKYITSFNKAWPKALSIVKELSESR